MFTGIVEEVGKIRYIQLNGNSSTGRYEDRRQYCGKWSMSDSHFPAT